MTNHITFSLASSLAARCLLDDSRSSPTNRVHERARPVATESLPEQPAISDRLVGVRQATKFYLVKESAKGD